MPSARVCVISAREADAITLGDVPSCRSHLHISRREAREWLEAEYGPERLIPTKLIPTGVRQRRYQAQFVRLDRRFYLVIEMAKSPQTAMISGMVCVQWLPGLPPEKPKPRPFISNGVTGDRACSAYEINREIQAPASLLPCQ